MLAALSVALAAPVASGAHAQGVHQGAPQGMAADLLPPHEVTTVIASMGMRPLSRPIWRGDRYVVFAIDRHGQEVRVVVDAHNGQVLAVRPSNRGGFAQGGYGRDAGAPPQGYDQGYAPPPPPGYPAARQAPYDPRYGAPPVPPGTVPGAPPPSGDEDYFDDDRQQGSLPPPPAGARTTSRDVPTGSAQRRVTAGAPKEKPARETQAKETPAKQITPVPRARPELAKVNDANPGAAKEAAKDVANHPAKKDVRVIDLNKPKPEAQAEPKPGEAIRF